MQNISIPIASPPWKGAGRRIESLCRKALYDFALVQEAPKVAVALSGGKDSLSLLYMLHAIKGRGFPDFDLIAIHVAGEFSCGAGVNQQWLKAICRELQVPFIERQSTQTLETLECYRCSRERRKLIFNAAKEEGAEVIAFGHHRDDSAQTLLMNLLQKGEFAANLPKVPMHRYGVTIIRPLIYVAEEEIRRFAQEFGFARITCQCPVGQKSKRKEIDKLLTQLDDIYPHARQNIASAGLNYGSDKALYL